MKKVNRNHQILFEWRQLFIFLLRLGTKLPLDHYWSTDRGLGTPILNTCIKIICLIPLHQIDSKEVKQVIKMNILAEI